MKKYWLFILVATFLLNACASSALPPATETVIPTATATFSPTSTPTPSAPTITPLPTIPTFTPTFDASTIVTVTPAPKAECPKENPELVADFPIPNENNIIIANEGILDFLNQGGSINATINRLAILGNRTDYAVKDVTGDGIPELLMVDYGVISQLYIFSCSNGKYISFSPYASSEGTYYSAGILAVEDINANGLSEIILYRRGCSGSGCYFFLVLEWDGNTFINAFPTSPISGVQSFELVDREDGLSGIELQGGMRGQCCYPGEFPVRATIDTYRWDGKTYQLSEWHYDDPVFRFQTVEDGDRESLSGFYDKALDLYQEAISNKSLEWWSKERAEFTINEFRFHPPNYPDFSSPPSIEPDETAIQFEYASLASYAYYRIMLRHLAQRQEPNADETYDTMQQTFGNDPYGRPFVEMAAAFRDAYQSAQKMYDGCAAAIQYAAKHPEILIPLGSDYHGAQSHTYKPEDVCPFR